MSTEIQQKINDARTRLDALSDAVRVEEGETRIRELEAEMSRPGFWDDNEKAQSVIDETKRVREDVGPVKELLESVGDLEELFEIADAEKDAASLTEIESEIDTVLSTLDEVELRTTLSGKHDRNGAFLSIHAGAGGTESCDWASMLLRIYTRWAEEDGFKVRIVDQLNAEEAGIRNVTLQIDGDYAYGYLKSEIGVHRLVRISPFDAQNRRHTSFASADVTPQITDNLEVDIKPADIRLDTYRAGGAGGQHVNKTDSAVRITHLATGLVVQCQNERSQHSNKAQAMKVLKSRLIQLEEAKREKELSQLYSEKGDIAWGNQIRSYVLQPYTLVKDHRTGCEIGNASSVLDGNIQPFIDSYLRWKRKGESERSATRNPKS